MSRSPWDNVELPAYPRLEQSGHFDVVIAGGGITGLSAALFLKVAGKKVCLLERDRLARGDTGCTTAHLTYVTDLRLTDMVKFFGREQAALVWHAGAAAINAIESTIEDLGIECRFRRVPGFLSQALFGKESEVVALREEAVLARELGFDAHVADAPCVDRPAIRFADQALFHPLQYLLTLAKAVDGQGGAIFEHSPLEETQDDPGAVKVNGHRVTCDQLIIATHSPLVGRESLLGATLFETKLAHYSSYAVGAKIPSGRYAAMSIWDTSDPYYYLRIDQQGDHDYAIFGGEDHKTGQANDAQQRFVRLEQVLRRLIPEAECDRRWSGQVIETNDGLPFIGPLGERQFIATGFSGNGMTFGTLAGLMARDWVLGHTNPWQEIFSPDRKKLRGGTWDYVKENLDFPYYFVKDRLTRAKVSSPDELEAGEAAVLKLDGQQVACHRTKEGELQCVSAVCTHMGCLVRWNNAETTWDCPCHGSRFSKDGSVLAGPAEAPLKVIEVADSKSASESERSARRPRETTPVMSPATATTLPPPSATSSPTNSLSDRPRGASAGGFSPASELRPTAKTGAATSSTRSESPKRSDTPT